LGNPRIISDGYNGGIVTWYDERNTVDANIYAQRVGVDGDMMWGSDGTNVCIAAGDQLYPELVSDGDYGAIIAWRDGRVVDHDVYAQRLNANGVPRWIHNGKPVCTELGYQNQVQITTDGDHGAIIAWRDARLSSQFDLWAQRLDANGDPVWRVDGAQVCLDYPEDQTRPRLVPDTKGGALFCWDDNRANPYYDVYANRVERGGYYGYPSATITDVADVPADEGGWVDLTWTKSRLDEYGEPVVHYTIWRRLPDQTAALLLASGEKGVVNWRLDAADAGPAYFFEEINGTTYGWEYIGDVGAARQASYTLAVPTLYDMAPNVDGTHYFKVIAHTEDEALFWESPEGSGYSVDNTAPGQTSGFSGEQSFSPPGLQLIWNANTESDLLHYKIYRGV
ncbi:MAG: hypothetical protein P8181_17540, partial [bacterium]